MPNAPSPGGYVLSLAGGERTPRLNRDLALVLALTAGLLNSVGFVAVGFYTSHMTGITAQVADHVVLGGARLVLLGVVSLASFIAGAMTCAVQFNWARRRVRGDRFALVLVTEAVLVLAIGVVADLVTWSYREWPLVAALCFVMGLQNALITKVSQATIRTTHVTGMVTDIGIELGKLAYRNRLADEPPVRADGEKLLTLTALVAVFFVGGLLGAVGYLALGFRVLIAPALCLFVLGIPPLLGHRATLRG